MKQLELFKSSRVGGLEDQVIMVMQNSPSPVLTTLDIAQNVYQIRNIDTQSALYRRVLRIVNDLWRRGLIDSYSHSQRCPVLWWLKSRLS